MISINSITIYPQNITITKGKWYYSAYAEICPSNATCKYLTWHSSNPNIASVNENGYICGVSEGVAIIYATAQDGSGAVGFCNVTVESPIKVSSVTVTPSTKSVTVGDTFTLSATVSPDNAEDKRIRWTSCDCSIADVDYLTGYVTAKAAGTTYIYANAVDGSGVYGCCEVAVNALIVEETINGLKAIKQCYIRIDTSLTTNSILEGSDGHDIVLQKDDTVYLLDKEPFTDNNNRSWYRILYDGMMVYVTNDGSFEEITLPPLATPTGCDVTVRSNQGDIEVRCIPSKDEQVHGTFANGTTVILTNTTPQNETWYPVYGQLNDGTYSYGWCFGWMIATSTYEKTLNVREQPDPTNGKILGSISYGEEVRLMITPEDIEENGYRWHKIFFNDSVAYVIMGENSPNFTYGNVVELKTKSTMDNNIDISTLTPIASNEYLTRSQMENNAMIVYDYLSNQGWSKNAICGAIANMQAESTINPGLWEKGNTTNPGYGLVQWTPATKWTDYADACGYSYSDLNRQLEYLIYSMQPGRGEWLVGGVTPTYQLYASEYIVSTRSAYDLAIVFLLCYERPLDQGDSVKAYRGSLANDWLSFFNSLG